MRTQGGEPAAAHLRKRIFHRGDDTADTCRDDPIGAGTSPAQMHAWLEGAVQRGAARGIARFVQRVHLRVRFACALVRALPDHNPFTRYDARTHHWIRGSSTEATARMVQGAMHPAQVLRPGAVAATARQGLYHFSWNSAST